MVAERGDVRGVVVGVDDAVAVFGGATAVGAAAGREAATAAAFLGLLGRRYPGSLVLLVQFVLLLELLVTKLLLLLLLQRFVLGSCSFFSLHGFL